MCDGIATVLTNDALILTYNSKAKHNKKRTRKKNQERTIPCCHSEEYRTCLHQVQSVCCHSFLKDLAKEFCVFSKASLTLLVSKRNNVLPTIIAVSLN